jgi:predicted HTH transcriptional regulator
MAHVIVDLSDIDLLARMKNFEDHLVERKTIKDEKDWKKTAVAFANSVPVGLPAVLYIGVRNSGEIETPQQNLDEAQKKFNAHMQRVYPRIAYVPKIISENGRQALAVIIPGSESRPHFAGLSYVRKGSETVEAAEEQFSELIAQRESKTRTLFQWVNKIVTVFWRDKRTDNRLDTFYQVEREQATLILVTPQWARFRVHCENGDKIDMTEPIEKLLLSWDDGLGQVKVEVIG